MNLRFPLKSKWQTSKGEHSASGFTLIEALVGMSMLAICTLMLIPVLQTQATWRQELRRQQFAQITLQNIAAELQADPPDEVSDTTLESRLVLSPETWSAFPDGKIDADIDTEAEPVGYRIRLRLSWRTNKDVPRSGVELVTWLYKRGGA